MSGEVVENSLSVQGMRWLHVIQMGAPVDREEWRSRLPEYAAEVECQVEHEPGLDLHHLRMWWSAREMVTLTGAAGVLAGSQVLLWKVDAGQNLREAAMYAGIAYADMIGRWPAWVGVQKLPDKATPEVEIYRDVDEEIRARLVELGWAPKGFLILGEVNL